MGFSGRKKWNPWNLKEIPGWECSHGMPWDQLPSLVFHILWKITMRSEWKNQLDPKIPHGGLGKVMGKSWNETGLNGELNRSIHIREEIDSIYSYTYIHIRGIQPYDS
jgi:hypothetical protein